MCRPLLLFVAILGGVAAPCLLTSSDLTAAPMLALSPAAVEGFTEGSIVQPVECIKYCVRKERRDRIFRDNRLVSVSRPCPSNGTRCYCVEWATACTGGHF